MPDIIKDLGHISQYQVTLLVAVFSTVIAMAVSVPLDDLKPGCVSGRILYISKYVLSLLLIIFSYIFLALLVE